MNSTKLELFNDVHILVILSNNVKLVLKLSRLFWTGTQNRLKQC